MKEKFSAYIDKLQDRISSALEKIDGTAHFQIDNWERPGGGGGQSRILENGAVFEKGGVNVSKVYGQLPETMKAYLKVKQGNFFACGISLVIHPNSPLVPTVHANFRYFELYDNNKEVVDQWFEEELTSRLTICLMRMWCIFISSASRFVMRMIQRSIKPLRTNAITIFGTRIGMRRAELGDFLTIAELVMNDQ